MPLPPKAIGWSRSSRRRGGAGRAAPGFRRRAISTAARWSSCAPAIRRAQKPVAGRGAGACRGDRRRCAGQPLMLKWPNDVLLLGTQARRNPARAERGPGRRRLRRQSRRRARSLRTGRARRSAARSLRKPSRPCSPRSFARLLGLWRSSEPACSPRPGWRAPIRLARRSTVHIGADETIERPLRRDRARRRAAAAAAATARSRSSAPGDVEL